MTEMVEFFKLSYYSYRGGKKLHQICSATCIYWTVFELKNILASIAMLLMQRDYNSKGTFLSESTDVFVITSHRRTLKPMGLLQPGMWMVGQQASCGAQ